MDFKKFTNLRKKIPNLEKNEFEKHSHILKKEKEKMKNKKQKIIKCKRKQKREKNLATTRKPEHIKTVGKLPKTGGAFEKPNTSDSCMGRPVRIDVGKERVR